MESMISSSESLSESSESSESVIESLILFGGSGIFSGVIVIMIIGNQSNLMQNLPLIIFLGAVVVRMLPMSNRLLISISTIRSISPSIRVVYEQINQIKNVWDDYVPDTDELNDFNELEFKNINHNFIENEKIIKNLSFKIQKNESVGIVGLTGSGKSTIINLLLGILKPTSGKILINNKQMAKVKKQWLNKIGYVAQDIFLINDTIVKNVIFGSKLDKKRLKKVLTIAQLDEWISSLPKNIDTIVGERGITISGGQKQRIGIARALYKEPEVLILDEATSSLDNNTQSKIIKNLNEINKTITTIVVAHRIETIKNCCIIYIIGDGKIIDSGNYEYLKKENKFFNQVINRQEL